MKVEKLGKDNDKSGGEEKRLIKVGKMVGEKRQKGTDGRKNIYKWRR